jgi:hypothetical protein
MGKVVRELDDDLRENGRLTPTWSGLPELRRLPAKGVDRWL